MTGMSEATAASLSNDTIFDILCRTPVRSVCRFRCVSRGWRDLISGPDFATVHRSRHGPLLVDTGYFRQEKPAAGRDMRLMDMEGNVIRVITHQGRRRFWDHVLLEPRRPHRRQPRSVKRHPCSRSSLRSGSPDLPRNGGEGA